MPKIALKEAIGLLKDLSVLEKVAKKLVNNPDAISEKISVALSELAISYQAVYDALVNLALLSFKKQEDLDETRKYLLEAQGGRIAAKIGEARDHCERIWNNYERYLRGWFSRVLNKNESSQLK